MIREPRPGWRLDEIDASVRSYRWKFRMPNRRTFSIRGVRDFLLEFCRDGLLIVDPFAKDAKIASPGFTNDLNPSTEADFHLKADEFLSLMLELHGEGFADVIVLDPPYSPRQVKECYDGIGLDVTSSDTRTSQVMSNVRALAARCLRPGGVAIQFGWDATGLGKKNGLRMIESHTLPHGSVNNATLITVEIKEEIA